MVKLDINMSEDTLVNTVRVPQPRQLEDTETMESLVHWWTQFRNYYRRDKYVGGFLISTTTLGIQLPTTWASRMRLKG